MPPAATERVRHRAAADGWDLVVCGAGEFDDPRYRNNPVDRCYFCKSNLYDRIRSLSPHPIASGANIDDLGDYRPGLLAASERAVVHPYIEAQMDKAAVRALARALGADDVAELPALPYQPAPTLPPLLGMKFFIGSDLFENRALKPVMLEMEIDFEREGEYVEETKDK